ncbi:hypothetical protein [Robertmurraya massiliosenegalensis]|uniref:hypothetical protein n=1 Tax=Robertmurraya massiliosenegalensis TaxID=1287657 RepID=UPI00036BABC6|nr:hypothetical protein [Robertmurraya massiliosenegalensis]
MKIVYFIGFIVFMGIFLVACQPNSGETMVLLDENVSGVVISESEGFGDMNLDIKLSFQDKESIRIFEKAITTAVEKSKSVESPPDYDVMVEYEEGYPTHAIHLWLGGEDEPSIMKYITDETVAYETSPQMTNKLRELILSE